MFDIKKVRPRIYKLTFDSRVELASHFLRTQEYWESTRFRHRNFDIPTYMKWYAKEREGDFSYFRDWLGFNVPCDVVIDVSVCAPDQNTQDRFMEALGRWVRELEGGEPAYLIGVPRDAEPDTLNHELAHGYYNTNKTYQREADAALSRVGRGLEAQLSTELQDMGYHHAVVGDEMQAYLATGFVEGTFEGISKPELDSAREPFIELFEKWDAKLSAVEAS